MVATEYNGPFFCLVSFPFFRIDELKYQTFLKERVSD